MTTGNEPQALDRVDATQIFAIVTRHAQLLIPPPAPPREHGGRPRPTRTRRPSSFTAFFYSGHDLRCWRTRVCKPDTRHFFGKAGSSKSGRWTLCQPSARGGSHKTTLEMQTPHPQSSDPPYPPPPLPCHAPPPSPGASTQPPSSPALSDVRCGRSTGRERSRRGRRCRIR